MPFSSLLPRDEQFFDYFEQAARNIVSGAQALADLLDDYQNVERKIERIRELEHVGDTLTHQVWEALHKTFVTPIDREDIATIIERLDDVMDYIDEAALSLQTYRIVQPTQRAQELAHIIVRAATEVEMAIMLLRKRQDLPKILPLTVEINRLENEGDYVFRHALAELFEEGQEDLTSIIKWREIYEHLETAIDRCEDVANALEGVVLKHG
ncbi:MAG TPA: DUF47 family protein [Dehalococcoidia bacterium]|nr:DUF47 family protein [Dehalococcoidia bacterium]